MVHRKNELGVWEAVFLSDTSRTISLNDHYIRRSEVQSPTTDFLKNSVLKQTTVTLHVTITAKFQLSQHDYKENN
jgi:hypothetical protein